MQISVGETSRWSKHIRDYVTMEKNEFLTSQSMGMEKLSELQLSLVF